MLALSISLTDIYHEMGYIKISPDDITIKLTAQVYQEVCKILKPKYNYQIVEGKIHENKIGMDQMNFKIGNTLAKLLKHSKQFAIFVATAGEEFEQYQKKLQAEGDIVKVYIADTLGSLIAERTGDIMEKALEQEIFPLKHTNRVSPGYCGWNITEQKNLFEYIGHNNCDIQLSDSCLMHPIKSISGVIGIGEEVTERIYACTFCELKTCYKRKLKLSHEN